MCIAVYQPSACIYQYCIGMYIRLSLYIKHVHVYHKLYTRTMSQLLYTNNMHIYYTLAI